MSAKAILLSRAQLPHSLGILPLTEVLILQFQILHTKPKPCSKLQNNLVNYLMKNRKKENEKEEAIVSP